MKNAGRFVRFLWGALISSSMLLLLATPSRAAARDTPGAAAFSRPTGSLGSVPPPAAPASSSAAAGPYWGEPRGGAWGAGVALGYPIGITAKLWLSRHNALDAGFGDRDGADFWADYDLQAWAGPGANSEGRLGAYLALGGEATASDNSKFGIRTLPGVNFWPRRVPVELYLEIGPVFHVAPGFGVGADGDVGVRYYFKK